jgi:hypothetical protein
MPNFGCRVYRWLQRYRGGLETIIGQRLKQSVMRWTARCE